MSGNALFFGEFFRNHRISFTVQPIHVTNWWKVCSVFNIGVYSCTKFFCVFLYRQSFVIGKNNIKLIFIKVAEFLVFTNLSLIKVSYSRVTYFSYI